jgi:GNAT superfamily N-acetyltransferase
MTRLKANPGKDVGAVARITIHPLTPRRFGDLASLFMQGGDPKWCWCQYYRRRGADWSSDARENREALRTLARRRTAPGLVAYRDGEAVGWVGLAPREDFERLETSKVLARIDDTPVWSIVCFVVGRHARGQGVATALLQAAIEYAGKKGASVLEAYPLSDTRGRVPAADAYHGSQSMFEKQGFQVVDVRQWNSSTPPRPIMRLSLT